MYKVLGVDQKEYGPVSSNELHTWISQRRLNSQSMVQNVDSGEGTGEWKPLASFPEFAQALAQAEAPVQPTPIANLPSAHSPQVNYYQEPRTNPMATASLIMGIISVTIGMCCCYGAPFNILGIIFGFLALSQIKNKPDLESGKGLAMTGIILSIISIVMAIGFIIMFVAMDGQNFDNFLREFR